VRRGTRGSIIGDVEVMAQEEVIDRIIVYTEKEDYRHQKMRT
jgi:hypothetical protein